VTTTSGSNGKYGGDRHGPHDHIFLPFYGLICTTAQLSPSAGTEASVPGDQRIEISLIHTPVTILVVIPDTAVE
jgi:hypothetical protein